MEFGQRALGNRSILADPRKIETVERINKKIKYRDFGCLLHLAYVMIVAHII